MRLRVGQYRVDVYRTPRAARWAHRVDGRRFGWPEGHARWTGRIFRVGLLSLSVIRGPE